MDSIDILNQDLSSVDTSRPLLAAGNVELTVAEMKVEPNKKQTGQNLNIVFKTVNSERSVKGETIAPGFPVFHTVSLTPTEKYTPESIQRSIKSLLEGLYGHANCPKTFGTTDDHLSKTCTAKLIVEESDQYPPSNRINRFVSKD